MGKSVRSARGELVDFDLLRIRENLGSSPKTSTVKAREDFIDNKFKRRMRRLAETTAVALPTAQVPPISDQVPQSEDPAPVAEPVIAPTQAQKKKIIKSTEQN